MIFKDTGFRPIYHFVCAFELNDKLRNLIKDCPEANKASHAVVYGYIDSKKGLMLEILGAGKQAPKYFYFKEPYEGKKISIPASDVKDVEFIYFPKLEPRFRKKYESHIAKLSKYAVPEDLEKSRTFEFLDELRDLQHPDDIKVILMKEGLNPEEVWVRLTGLGEHVLIGTLLNQPYQNYGINKGDPVHFNAKETEDKKIICFLDMNDHEFSKEDLSDGSLLKAAIEEFNHNKNEDSFGFALTVLRSGSVIVPCDVNLSDKASAIMDKLKSEGKDIDSLEGEDEETFRSGIFFNPNILENDGHRFFPAFSSAEEMGDHLAEASKVNMPFLHAIDMALDGDDVEGIVVNPYTDNFIVGKDIYDIIRKLTPLIDEESSETPTEGSSESFSNQPDLGLRIDVGKMDVFNFALYQNDVAPIRGIRIQNTTGDPMNGLSLKITSDFDFFKPYEYPLPTIPSGKPVSLSDPHLIVNGSTLATMTEAVNTVITVEICKNNETVCGCRGQMQVLAYDQWQGGNTYQDLLPAFVVPNHPVIPALLHDAADRLKKWGKNTSLEGYQSGDPNRVRELAAAAYAAIQKKNIVYAEPPASFSVLGQRIRTPETIMEQRLGTCMDMTLLYAACLEAMGLHPLLVMMNGHIFAGVWLKERSIDELKAGNVIIDNLEQLTMRFNNGADEMTFVECTAMCSGKQMSFEDAEKAAKLGNLSNSQEFRFAIDVQLSRIHGIKPIASRVRDGAQYQIDVEEKSEDELTQAPSELDITISDVSTAKTHKIMSKKELWESKLLDLSTHNMLLNLPHNASIEPIMSSHIDELEDALADGHEFHLLPAADWITGLAFTRQDSSGKESKPIQWLPEAIKENGIFEMTDWPVSADFDFNEKFRQEYRNHRLYTFCTSKQLDRELTTIYRAARSSQQENGVSSLYLAVGLLRWFVDAESEEPCYAPLILLPIEIVRKSANQGYALHARQDEPHFNSTLLKMLKQVYNIQIDGLDPLPMDDHGINIKKIFATVRSKLFTVKNWDVVETCVIGNFSFAQFAMWNDIHTAGTMLDNSNVVRSLMKGHVDWDITLPEVMENQKTYLPITVDATQLKAIKMAANGSTFVLHGPPGTGKSQTITGMIANLMAQGKKVLFVAEKMAALSVVQRRLASLGIGDFCLELHSDKANKKQVLTQLDKALAIKHPNGSTEYEDYLNRTAASRAKLDGYAKHLHTTYEGGYSLRELIDLYETVRDSEQDVPFDPTEAGKLTRDQIKKHSALITQLTAAGEGMGTASRKSFVGIGLTAYSAEVRGSLRRDANDYISALESLRIAGTRLAEIFKMDPPKNKSDLASLERMLTLYAEGKGTNPLVLKLLNSDSSFAYRYFDEEDKVTEQKVRMLKIWKEDFLNRDIQPILARHEAAGKKFFGKGSAMSAVVSEVQPFANINVTYEQIPALLSQIKQYQDLVQNLNKEFDNLPEEIREIISQVKTRDAYRAAEDSAKECKKQADAFPGGLCAILDLAAKKENENYFADYKSKSEAMILAETVLNQLLVRDEYADSEDWFNTEIEFCKNLLVNSSELKEWAIYNQIRQECIKVGLLPVIKAYEDGLDASALEKAYRKGLYYALINHIISTDDVLSGFSGATFNASIQQFKQLDEQMLVQTKQEIYHLLASRVPTSWDSPEVGMELNLLRKAIGSNARGMSIRSLFERIPHVLPTLCPCMLMSPNSVAQYLGQDNNLFDVVIFDEASQLPTCKAVGALARAKSAVIVGDPKQMPPTAFFAGSGPEVDDLALDDLDSILDDALALGIPSQHLQWHYRSTHESLIAFSNHEFYDNKMYTFPSANDRERHVTAVHVEGLYSKSTNVKEAEAVVEEIIRRFLDPELKKQSIGVVTFNVKQQTLIENLLAKQFQINPELDLWANGGDDPLFVKNLENVQGDERDVILFSIGYGPDEKGHISMNFGPINKTGGGKRLNVAFSRARITMTIFASLYSSDIKVTETSPEGLIAFRDFLKFAEGQDIQNESSSEAEKQLVKAGILQCICRELSAHGYQCETMVGHSDFHVDIAVVDPYVPTQYMMGILLDGDGYKQTKNTRDREVAQIGVLKNLGWSLTRVWTIDWWDNREKVLQKLLNKLDALKLESEKRFETEKAEEGTRNAEAAARDAETARVKAELEAQAAAVVAEDEEAEIEAKIIDVSESPRSKDTNSKSDAEEVTASHEVTENHPEPSEDNSIAAVVQKIAEAGGKVIDKRQNGGALWIVGGKNLQSIMKEFKALGVHFVFKAGGGKATGGKDGWWAKTDIIWPDSTVKNISEPVRQEEVKQATEERQNSEVEKSKVGATEIPSLMEAQIFAPIEYMDATLPESSLSQQEYAASNNKKEIADRILTVVAAEAPILKETLFRKVWASFGIQKTTTAIEATEKALKAAKVKTTKQKGIVFCWNGDQDPKTYDGIRISNARSGDEICPQEIKNAMCYVLKTKGDLDKATLVKETSLLFGYKRLGKNLEAILQEGLKYAKSSGAVTYLTGGIVSLSENENSKTSE